MTDVQENSDTSPSAIWKGLNREAKFWWGVSLSLKLVGFLIAALSLVPWVPAKLIPFAVAVVAILAELISYKSDALKSDAQLLRRRLDWEDSLGWPISKVEYSDLLARREWLMDMPHMEASSEPYFASQAPTGRTRAIENVTESAWWSKHVCDTMAGICLAFVLSTGVFSVVLLIIASLNAVAYEAHVAVARMATSLLAFTFSLGLFNLLNGYLAFSRKAGRIEQAADALPASGASDVDAIKLFQEYHLARATAPMIPEWIWQRRRTKLNALWGTYRTRRA